MLWELLHIEQMCLYSQASSCCKLEATFDMLMARWHTGMASYGMMSRANGLPQCLCAPLRNCMKSKLPDLPSHCARSKTSPAPFLFASAMTEDLLVSMHIFEIVGNRIFSPHTITVLSDHFTSSFTGTPCQKIADRDQQDLQTSTHARLT